MKQFEAVTADFTVDDIGKVKVQVTETIPAEELATILKWKPEFKAPEPQMYRLELIDADLANLQKQADDLDALIADKQALRVQVAEAAATVKLKVL